MAPKPVFTEPLWHAQVAIVSALVLQFLLPDRLVVGPRYILPILESLLLAGLTITTKQLEVFNPKIRRLHALTLIALISLANIYSLQRLTRMLLSSSSNSLGHELILVAINIFLTNIIIFGLWYWEIDGGGPSEKRTQLAHEKDFLFSQMANPQIVPRDWFPTFIDYFYVSVTNAMAFSPTDTMPLTRRAKMLMALQALVSLVTIALVAARAVNI